MKISRLGIIVAVVHFILFAVMWFLTAQQIICSEWTCLGYLILIGVPWTLLLVFLEVTTFLGDGYTIILLNFVTYYILGYLIDWFRHRKDSAQGSVPPSV